MTSARGCPVAVSVFDGNTADAATFVPQVTRLRTAFGIDTLVVVGDRGMISQKAIRELRDLEPHARAVIGDYARRRDPLPRRPVARREMPDRGVAALPRRVSVTTCRHASRPSLMPTPANPMPWPRTFVLVAMS